MKDKSIDELINILDTTTDESTRIQAARSLGQIDPGNETAISALVNLLEITTDESTRIQVAECLVKIATGNEWAISALVKLLKTTTDEVTRIYAAISLGQIGKDNETAISALVKLLETTTHQSTRRQVAESLVQIGTGNETAISLLVNLLENSTDEDTRRQAAESLGEIDPGNETAILALIDIWENTQYEDNRTLAINKLHKTMNTYKSPAIIPACAWDMSDDEEALTTYNISREIILNPNLNYPYPVKGNLNPAKSHLNFFEISLEKCFDFLGNCWSIPKLIFGKTKFAIQKLYRFTKKLFLRLLKFNNSDIIVSRNDYEKEIRRPSQVFALERAPENSVLPTGMEPALILQLDFSDNSDNSDSSEKLFNILLDNKSELIQWKIIDAINKIEFSHLKKINTLITVLNSTGNEFIQWQCIKNLQPNLGQQENYRIFFGKIKEYWQSTNNLFLLWQISEYWQDFKNPLESNHQSNPNFYIHYNKVINCIDVMQEGRDLFSRRLLIKSCLEVHHRIIQFCIQSANFSLTFFYTEIFRNRYLVERLAQQDAALPSTISKQLAQDINTAKQRERQTLQAYTDGINQHLSEGELEALGIEWENAKQTLETLYRQVADIEPEFIAKTKVYPLSFQEVQDLLPPDTAIIEFFFTENELITLLILPGHESPLIPEELRVHLKPQNPLERLALDWVEDLADKSKSKDDAIQTTQEQLPSRIDHLGELLNFRELEKYLPRPIQQLIIVPNNSLHLFPIHAVPLNPTERLIDRFSVRYFPNLHIWKICQNRQRSRQSFLGIENPTEDKDLIFAKAEIASICQRPNFRENHEVFTPRNAKKSKILEEAKNYHCFHFSGHAEYNFKNPLDSYLMLSEDHQEDLTLSTLFADLHLPDADLVTLSACCTGVVDAFQPTDECLGIATGFLLAGAKAVVSSLWKVNSIATAFLLDEFYRQLEQTPDKAVALQNAQNWLRTRTADELRNRANNWDLSKLEPKEQFRLERALKRLQGISFENPYFWAAFIVTGV